ncbi:MAG TPA: cytochrome b/b6 domain-containing protein [Usitatibacter sp.]|jgi:thiosulfate reductase cytochrome b subunit|nr:cytochrome b/b6 domain-containing protein [Usitatibacter sp.]
MERSFREQRRHSLPVRVMHWINVIAVLALLMSGLQIFNAHPSLYWGASSYTGRPAIFSLAHGFPGWATLPGVQWLAMGRRWHFFFAWVFVINGIAYIAYSIASGHARRDLVPTRTDWRSIGRSIVEHLRLHHPVGDEATRYNVLQRLAYVGLIFVVLPFLILMGLGLSPRLDAAWPWLVDAFGGRQSMRTLHFIAASVLVLFVLVHLFEVIVSGPWNQVRSMITGKFRVPEEK